ncbi:TIGR03086 family metal-binding protein [Kribbella pittospori]|uniref:TIGR03086 family metal-binding protein n=1 Tax=Kribbella pittospori TaxID=722689 RepID=UPI0013F4776F|nr:TIGR03086 family metal-binding protein [Kribbella pittospori]
MRNDERLTLLANAVHITQAIVDHITPADLTRPTPCGEYDVRRLLEHLIGWHQVFAACAVGHEPPFADGSPTYTLTDDPARDLREAELVANLGQAPATIDMPYRGETPVEHLIEELVAETVIHTWDLATGLGHSIRYDDATVALAHAGLTRMLAESFAEEGFRPPTDLTASTEFERLLVRSGR